MNETQQSSFSGWAKVEVMGHQQHVGFVRTEVYGAAAMFRVEWPELPEREYVLDKPQHCHDPYCWAPAGSKVTRPAAAGGSVLLGSTSIYRMTPCTEAAAMLLLEETRPPLKLVELPPNVKQIGATNEASEEAGEGLCADCHRPAGLCACEDEDDPGFSL